MIITAGAVVGCVSGVDEHPDGQRIWLAKVDLGSGGALVQIVFGGKYKVKPGELVPVAPPGARGMVLPTGSLSVPRYKKMRNRRYRGQRSHGMLCSLNELGWAKNGPDEVAVLCGLKPGDCLDRFPVKRRFEVVLRNKEALLPVTIEQEVAEMVDGVFDPPTATQTTIPTHVIHSTAAPREHRGSPAQSV